LPRNFDGGSSSKGKRVRAMVDLNLTHLTASVPLADQQISYLNAALVQPMVVYLNTNYVSIPVHAVISIPLSYFDGAWSPYAAAMTDALSEAVGVELSHKVSDQKRPKNILWMLVMGFDGIWRATKHSAYLLWHGYVLN
jgi:distribution and morphology protein 31